MCSVGILKTFDKLQKPVMTTLQHKTPSLKETFSESDLYWLRMLLQNEASTQYSKYCSHVQTPGTLTWATEIKS